MSGRPPGPIPPVGASGLPNLDTFEIEATATRKTETQIKVGVSSASRLHPILTVLTGFDAGRVCAVADKMVVGRGSECGVLLSDRGVSRAHARFAQEGAKLLVHDLGSKNGTSVGGEVVSALGRALAVNDVIGLGPHVSLRFSCVTEAEERLARDLYESSMRDPLTRAYNRRYLASRLQAEVAYVLRHGGALSLVTFDFDHFKKLNDQHGHAVGDEVLTKGASLIAATLRSEDVLARIGGEEFVIVLRGIGREAAIKCAERVRQVVERAEFCVGTTKARATISAGVASNDEAALDVAGLLLLKLADARLYEAKAAGRNTVVGPAPGVRI